MKQTKTKSRSNVTTDNSLAKSFLCFSVKRLFSGYLKDRSDANVRSNIPANFSVDKSWQELIQRLDENIYTIYKNSARKDEN